MGMTSMSIWQFTTSWKWSAQRFNLSSLLCRTLLSLATRLDEAGLENFLPKRCRSLIREPRLPCCSATRARRSASAARSLHQALRAFSAATLVRFLRWSYLILRRVMSCGSAFFKRAQAFFLPGQIAHFIGDPIRFTILLGADGRDFWMDDLKLFH